LLNSAIGQQGDPVARDHKAIGAARGLLDHSQQASAHRLCAGHPHLGTLQGIQEGGRRVECCSVEGEIDKGLGQRLATRQSDLTGGAAIVIDDEAFENIVDLVERHIQAQCRVAVNHGFVLEITDTAARQHDPLEREICGVNRPYYRQKSCRQPPSIHDRLPAENA
jgi:hypothetical protein